MTSSTKPVAVVTGGRQGIGLGIALLYAALFLLQPYVDANYGLYLPIDPPKPWELVTLGAVAVAGWWPTDAAAIPAWGAIAGCGASDGWTDGPAGRAAGICGAAASSPRSFWS